jgi:eukaryotic-like serine/threonine-protein kinase
LDGRFLLGIARGVSLGNSLQITRRTGYDRPGVQRAQQLGRYHLLDRIAFGGMAEIYRAKTFDSGGHIHLVAVKRVLAHLVEDDDFIQMLVDEAKIASLLSHPNVARVYEFARAQGEYFIAMEYIDGKDTRTILERRRALGRPLPPQHAAYVAGEIAFALHAAHGVADARGRALKLVHRDVSPSNIVCAYTGEVKLCDFGIAKATLSSVQTKTGIIKGKIKYMSPEQAMGRKLDHRSDLFSLGTCLYEMLTNVPPFTAANEMDLILKVRDARYRPVRELEPAVPEPLEEIVDRALARSRSARFQTADEMGRALRGFLQRHAPGYGRSHMGRYLRSMFAREIEQELRVLEDYVLEEPDPAAVGENLIADVLGPDAAYAKFTPASTGSSTTTRAAAGGEATSGPQTVPDPEPPRARPPRPGDAGFHAAETMILGREGQAAPAAAHRRPHPGSPGGRDPRELDPAIHDAPTQIIKPRK